MAARSSGRPAAGVYLWLRGSRHAAAAASTMWAGVGKSGSPAPKPTTSTPAACSAFALASTARVADGAIAPMRALIRACCRGEGVLVTCSSVPGPHGCPYTAFPGHLETLLRRAPEPTVQV